MSTVTLRIGAGPVVLKDVEVRQTRPGQFEVRRAPGEARTKPLLECGQLQLFHDGETVAFLGCYYILDSSSYEVLRVLATTAGRTISGKELCRMSGNPHADRIYRRMRQDVPWRFLLRMNDKGGRGYGLVDLTFCIDHKRYSAFSGPSCE